MSLQLGSSKKFSRHKKSHLGIAIFHTIICSETVPLSFHITMDGNKTNCHKALQYLIQNPRQFTLDIIQKFDDDSDLAIDSTPNDCSLQIFLHS